MGANDALGPACEVVAVIGCGVGTVINDND